MKINVLSWGCGLIGLVGYDGVNLIIGFWLDLEQPKSGGRLRYDEWWSFTMVTIFQNCFAYFWQNSLNWYYFNDSNQSVLVCGLE
jgi:hypothetical protein